MASGCWGIAWMVFSELGWYNFGFRMPSQGVEKGKQRFIEKVDMLVLVF